MLDPVSPFDRRMVTSDLIPMSICPKESLQTRPAPAVESAGSDLVRVRVSPTSRFTFYEPRALADLIARGEQQTAPSNEAAMTLAEAICRLAAAPGASASGGAREQESDAWPGARKGSTHDWAVQMLRGVTRHALPGVAYGAGERCYVQTAVPEGMEEDVCAGRGRLEAALAGDEGGVEVSQGHRVWLSQVRMGARRRRRGFPAR